MSCEHNASCAEDVCDGDVCQHETLCCSNNDVYQDDKAPCTQDWCAHDVCFAPIVAELCYCGHDPIAGCSSNDDDCNDGDPCNGSENCAGGTRQPGSALCDGGESRTIDSCKVDLCFGLTTEVDCYGANTPVPGC